MLPMELISSTNHCYHRLIAGVFLLTLSLLAGLIISGENQSIFLWLNNVLNHLHPLIWLNLTQLGDYRLGAFFLLLGIILRPSLFIRLSVAAMICTLLVQAGKFGLEVARPSHLLEPHLFTRLVAHLDSYSMPSAHSSVGGFLSGVLVFICRRTPYLMFIWALTGFLIALSRIAVGVHWPMDILAGHTLGWLFAFAGAYWFQHAGAKLK